jgi:hypothetical protein
MGNDQKVVRRSKNETMWAAILGISLYSYLYFKLAKMLCLSYYLLCFLFNKIEEQEGRPGSAWKQGVGQGREKGGPNNIYTYE